MCYLGVVSWYAGLKGTPPRVDLSPRPAVVDLRCFSIERFFSFSNQVRMWVYQEQVDGKNLTEIINEEHENVK